MAQVETFAIESDAGDHVAYVSLPDAYNNDEALRFPVLFTTDGDDFLAPATAISRWLTLGQHLEPIIIVAIGYPTSKTAECSISPLHSIDL